MTDYPVYDENIRNKEVSGTHRSTKKVKHKVGDIINLKAKTEARLAYDELAKARRECYQAYRDAEFDHEDAISFVLQDFSGSESEELGENEYILTLDSE